jgi:hypothetical protein
VADNALMDEWNRAEAARQAREAEVAGAKSPDEAYKLGAAHGTAASAAAANRAAYFRGMADADKAAHERAAKKAAPAAPAAASPKASATAPSAKPKTAASAMAEGRELAQRATAYIEQQATLGKKVTAAQAVAIVSNI